MPRDLKAKAEYKLHDVNMFPTITRGERIIYLGTHHNKTTVCWGVGTLIKVQKGENFDLITMDFGGRWQRKIIVKTTMARKQIYTMKVNQLAWFVGTRKTFIVKNKKTKKNDCKVVFYAFGFQGWYVPKAFDIKNIDPQEIIEEKLEKKAESQIEIIDKIIDGGIT